MIFTLGFQLSTITLIEVEFWLSAKSIALTVIVLFVSPHAVVSYVPLHILLFSVPVHCQVVMFMLSIVALEEWIPVVVSLIVALMYIDCWTNWLFWGVVIDIVGATVSIVIVLVSVWLGLPAKSFTYP